MNKDVIYIDVDDDITAIIGKIKGAGEKVVALVPPKRVGVLQSAVNMRLLNRAAENAGKRLVLITGNSSLVVLAASAAIPVAKTLQSKPEIPTSVKFDAPSSEEVIDGNELPVGMYADAKEDTGADAEIETLPAFDSLTPAAASAKPLKKATPPAPGQAPAKPKAKKGFKVPNFNTFRKKLFIFGGLGVLLIAFLVWAIFFAPRATVIISAQTTPEVVNQVVRLTKTGSVSPDDRTLPALFAEKKEAATQEITPTGQKDVGERATGTMTISRSGVSDQPTSIPAGTGFSSGDYTFVTTEVVTVPRSNIVGNRIDSGSVSVSVQAMEIGPEYNLNARSYDSSMSGFSGRGSQMQGGTKKQVTVVSEEDVAKVVDELESKTNSSMKATLKKELGSNVTAIDESYLEEKGNPSSSPAVGQEASRATVSLEVTYSLAGISRNDLNTYLDDALKSQISNADEQRIYDNGLKKIVFAQYEKVADGATVQLTANGQTGPKIEDDMVKDDVKGKRYGEVQSQLESVEGISDVDVRFWPFWVQKVPNNTDRITIEFKLKDES